MLREDEIERLAEAIKLRERQLEPLIPNASEGFVARLDGVAFRTYTASLAKPFDARFTNVMQETAKQCMQHFQAGLAFVQSDEISLFFSPRLKPPQQVFSVPYNGRVVKLASVLAGAASCFFAEAAIRSGLPSRGFFDARIVHFEPRDVLIWRAHDLRRNAINSIGQHVLGHREVHGVSLGDLHRRLVGQFGDLADKYGRAHLFGSVLQRRIVDRPGFDPIRQQAVVAKRAVIYDRQIDLLAPDAISELLPSQPPSSEAHKI